MIKKTYLMAQTMRVASSRPLPPPSAPTSSSCRHLWPLTCMARRRRRHRPVTWRLGVVVVVVLSFVVGDTTTRCGDGRRQCRRCAVIRGRGRGHRPT
jgi:hypothetical protein